MAVITGPCGGPYTPVDCDAGINDAQFVFNGTAGTTYYIIIDGIDGDQCDFDILIKSGQIRQKVDLENVMNDN